MTHSSYKNGALKEAHCTMNKQIGVKNTETLTRYHEKRQGRGREWEGKGYKHGSDNQKGASSMGMEERQVTPGPTWSSLPTTGYLLQVSPTPTPTWSFK
jgi:hypothetical protein